MTVSIKENFDKINAHTSDKSNPHGVTVGQIGAAPAVHNHDSDYYKKSEVDTQLVGKSNTSHGHSLATANADGFMPKADKSKLDGLPTNAYTKTEVDGKVNGKADSGHGHNTATTLADGFMSKADKSKLDTLPADAYSKSEINSQMGGKSATSHGHTAATTSADGFMSKADKAKLDGISSGAGVNSVTSVNGKTGAVNISANDLSDVYSKTEVNNAITAGDNNQVSKSGDTMTGSLKSTFTHAFISKTTGKKSWLMHNPTNSDALIFAPSLTINGEDWDWTNQVVLNADGTITGKGGKIATTAEVNAVQSTLTNGWKQKTKLTEDNGTNITISNQDLNSVKVNGFYMGTGLKNAPTTNTADFFFIEVQRHMDTWVYQRATLFNVSSKLVTWERVCFSGTWQPWSTMSPDKGWGLFSTNGGQDFLARGKRAMVAMENELHINYTNDFAGGTRIGSNLIAEKAITAAGDIVSTSRLYAGPADHQVIVGAGSEDVYLSNKRSAKYLQLKDDGRLLYANNRIRLEGQATYGSYYYYGSATRGITVYNKSYALLSADESNNSNGVIINNYGFVVPEDGVYSVHGMAQLSGMTPNQVMYLEVVITNKAENGPSDEAGKGTIGSLRGAPGWEEDWGGIGLTGSGTFFLKKGQGLLLRIRNETNNTRMCRFGSFSFTRIDG